VTFSDSSAASLFDGGKLYHTLTHIITDVTTWSIEFLKIASKKRSVYFIVAAHSVTSSPVSASGLYFE
jgi:hypothetical protein